MIAVSNLLRRYSTSMASKKMETTKSTVKGKLEIQSKSQSIELNIPLSTPQVWLQRTLSFIRCWVKDPLERSFCAIEKEILLKNCTLWRFSAKRKLWPKTSKDMPGPKETLWVSLIILLWWNLTSLSNQQPSYFWWWITIQVETLASWLAKREQSLKSRPENT